MGFPGGSAGKESYCNVGDLGSGDLGSIPGLGRSPGEGNGYPLQYSGLENSMDCSPWGRNESGTTEQLSQHVCEYVYEGFPHSSVGKEYSCNAGNPSSVPGSGRYTGEGIGYPLQYSCLENSLDRGARWAIIHGVAKSRTRLSD